MICLTQQENQTVNDQAKAEKLRDIDTRVQGSVDMYVVGSETVGMLEQINQLGAQGKVDEAQVSLFLSFSFHPFNRTR